MIDNKKNKEKELVIGLRRALSKATQYFIDNNLSKPMDGRELSSLVVASHISNIYSVHYALMESEKIDDATKDYIKKIDKCLLDALHKICKNVIISMEDVEE